MVQYGRQIKIVEHTAYHTNWLLEKFKMAYLFCIVVIIADAVIQPICFWEQTKIIWKIETKKVVWHMGRDMVLVYTQTEWYAGKIIRNASCLMNKSQKYDKDMRLAKRLKEILPKCLELGRVKSREY
jgi:hypothetical protein